MRCRRLELFCDYEPRRKSIVNYGWGMATQSCGRPSTTPPAFSTPAEVAGTAAYGHVNADARQSWMRPEGVSSLHHEPARYTDTHPLPLVQLPAPNIAASSVELSTDDHESIRYYRTSFAQLYHTKNPRYSMFAVMLTVAERSRMVMHMILALAKGEIDLKRRISHGRNGGDEPYKNTGNISRLKSRSLHHYSAALRLMADLVGQGAAAGDAVDLDFILTALYLMLTYEQMFGSRQGLLNHLAGAASIVRHHCAHLVRPVLVGSKTGTSRDIPPRQQQHAFSQTAQPGSEPQLSQYSARLLSRVALSDAAITTYGIGGDVISALYDAMGLHHHQTSNSSPFNPLETFDSLERYAITLYRNVWGESYPPTELAEDIENRPVFALYGACLQLRFLLSQLSASPTPSSESLSRVHATIRVTATRFADLLKAAAAFTLATDGSRRVVTNLRFVVPHYYAVVLEFLRLTVVQRTSPSPGLALDDGEVQSQLVAAQQGIMSLAVQAFRHEGDEAMLRIAQPLFMVALETEDVLHREWVLERFKGLHKFGERFERARVFLVSTIEMQEVVGRRVDVRERFRLEERSPSVFVF